MTELIEAAARALNGKDPEAEAPASAAAPSHSEPLVGAGRTMQSLFKEIGRVAATPLTVLIRGETGTGKELVARALHRHSDRADRPLVTVNCAAIPESLLESELFGHERGAFTGAAQRRIGRFEQAQHGTVFLDEIGEMSLSTQAKLLRVLQERTVQRLGSPETLPVDIRVIAATHRDLESAMEQKLFREDLFYRLNVVPLRIPPLREHPEDIPGLVEHFLQCHGPELGFASFSVQPAALPLLREQPWPGNVRQLENVVRQALLLSPSGTLTPDEVCQALKRAGPTEPGEPLSLKEWVTEFLRRGRQECWPDLRERALEALERELFTQTIDLAQGNQAEASRWLGVSRLTMREKLTRFGKRPNGQS